MKLQDETLEVTHEAEAMQAPVEAVGTEPTNAQIDRWKAEHGKVFKNVIAGDTYIWRRLKRSEYVAAMAIESDVPTENMYLRQDAIARAVTIFPSVEVMSERIEEFAGLAGEIADRAVLKSGFQASETEEL